MRTKRKPQYVAKDIYVGHGGITIDGVRLPWYFAPEVDVVTQANDFHGVTLTFWAGHVTVEPTSEGDTVTLDDERMDEGFDTTLVHARQEALDIVRRGLADVMLQIDDDKWVR